MNNGQNIQSYSITEYRRNVGIYGERIILRLAQLAYECVMNTNPNFDFSSGEIPRIDYGNLPAMRKGYSITPINTPRWKYFNVSIPVHDIMPKGDDSHYRILREHIKGIASIVLETVEDDSKNARIYHLVNEVDTEKGIIYLNLREEVWQAMLDFSKGYRYYDIDKTFTLNSAYSVRFYLLMAGQKQALNFSMENLRKMLALEEKYKAELAGAGYDTGKLTPLGKQFYDEAGPVPESVKPTLFMSKPIVISLYQYQQSLSALEKKDEITPTGTWICSVCGNENQGNFCGCCGKKITLNP